MQTLQLADEFSYQNAAEYQFSLSLIIEII